MTVQALLRVVISPNLNCRGGGVNSSCLPGQATVVEISLVDVVQTQHNVPPQLQILGNEHLLKPLEPMEASLLRNYTSLGSSVVDSLS